MLAGRLALLRRADTTAIAGAWVVAHRVGTERQGPIDSMRTDARGRFRFAVAAPESAAVYVVSALHDGIGYFSQPVAGRSPRPAPVDLAVFDTSSSGPALTVGMRNVVVTRASDGGHRVLDIYQVVNGGATTRVGRDSTAPTWTTRLPGGAARPAPGGSDIPATAIRFQPDGAVAVSAPFPPGEKQVVLTYDLPAGTDRLDVTLDHPTAQLELLLEDSTAQASGVLTSTEPLSLEGHAFRRFAADSLKAGSAFSVRFGAAGRTPLRGTLVVALVAALALGGGAIFALRRRAPLPAAEAPGVVGAPQANAPRERLVAQLAALDERFAGREHETPPEAWATYRTRRAELKAELARRLAQG